MAPKGQRQSRGAEHRKIMEAVLDRDFETSQALIDKHIRKTADRAVKLL
jgi:DNA-binding GntR family transcriptional regulator